MLPNDTENLSGETEANISVELVGLNSRTIRTTNIELINLSDEENYSYDVISKSLNVVVRGKTALVEQIYATNLRAVADLSDYTEPGLYKVPVTVYVDGYTGRGHSPRGGVFRRGEYHRAQRFLNTQWRRVSFGGERMYGYIRPLKAELKVREFEAYHAMYCGLCRTLGKRYGLAARFLVSYDLTYLCCLLDGSAETWQQERCFCPANPFCKKDCTGRSNALDYAADLTVLLGWQKFRDAAEDEQAFKSWPRNWA